jgi:hypothetical protein
MLCKYCGLNKKNLVLDKLSDYQIFKKITLTAGGYCVVTVMVDQSINHFATQRHSSYGCKSHLIAAGMHFRNRTREK